MKCFMRPEARAELNDATIYYERLREDLGDEFIEDFLLGITEVEEAPLRWPEATWRAAISHVSLPVCVGL